MGVRKQVGCERGEGGKGCGPPACGSTGFWLYAGRNRKRLGLVKQEQWHKKMCFKGICLLPVDGKTCWRQDRT